MRFSTDKNDFIRDKKYRYVLHLFITLSTCVLQERVLSMVTPSNFSEFETDIWESLYDIPGKSCGIILWLCLEVTNMILDFVTLIAIWSFLLRSSESVEVLKTFAVWRYGWVVCKNNSYGFWETKWANFTMMSFRCGP